MQSTITPENEVSILWIFHPFQIPFRQPAAPPETKPESRVEGNRPDGDNDEDDNRAAPASQTGNTAQVSESLGSNLNVTA